MPDGGLRRGVSAFLGLVSRTADKVASRNMSKLKVGKHQILRTDVFATAMSGTLSVARPEMCKDRLLLLSFSENVIETHGFEKFSQGDVTKGQTIQKCPGQQKDPLSLKLKLFSFEAFCG